MSLVWEPDDKPAEWRSTARGMGWHIVLAADDKERIIYSGPDENASTDLYDYEARRCKR